MAEQGFHFRDVGGVFAESVIVGNGFGFGIDQEFVGVAAAGFAIERGAPLAKDFFQFFLLSERRVVRRFRCPAREGRAP